MEVARGLFTPSVSISGVFFQLGSLYPEPHTLSRLSQGTRLLTHHPQADEQSSRARSSQERASAAQVSPPAIASAFLHQPRRHPGTRACLPSLQLCPPTDGQALPLLDPLLSTQAQTTLDLLLIPFPHQLPQLPSISLLGFAVHLLERMVLSCCISFLSSTPSCIHSWQPLAPTLHQNLNCLYTLVSHITITAPPRIFQKLPLKPPEEDPIFPLQVWPYSAPTPNISQFSYVSPPC